MKKGIFLYGINCTVNIWTEIRSAFIDMELTFVEYPHELTQSAHSISDITTWVYEEYGKEQYDFIVGHSMGGLIALELVAEYKLKCDTIIFIESNLRPAKEFYRNLMMPSNMIKYGDKITNMFKEELPYYKEELKLSLQKEFDFTPFINKISGDIFGIYGDRGIEHYSKRIDDLCLNKNTEEKITFRFIRNACHMPMVENPMDFNNVLMKCIH